MTIPDTETMLAQMLPCDRQTPLAEPVVPEVNSSTRSASGSTSSVPNASAPFPRRSFPSRTRRAMLTVSSSLFIFADQTALERVPVQLGQRLDVPDDGFAVGFV